MAEDTTMLSGDETGATEVATAETATGEAAETANPKTWRDDLPESIRGDATLAKYEKPEDAYQALIEAQKLIGKKAEGIVPPGKDAKPEEVEAFQKKLREIQGVPEKPEGYELPKIDALPEGMPEIPQEVSTAFKTKAHELGLTPEQLQGVYAWYLSDVEAPLHLSRVEFSEKAKEAGLSELRKEFAGKTSAVLEDAKFTMHRLGLTDADIGPAGNNPRLIKALAALAPEYREGGMKGKGATASGLTKEEARTRGREMMRDPRYSDPSQRDAGYVRQVEKFFEDHFPGEHGAASRAAMT